MKFDEYGLLRMEHDTTLQGSIGDSCAETGRFVALGGDIQSTGATHFPCSFDKVSYWAYTQTHISPARAVRHPLSIDPSFGPDQFVPRKLVTGSNLGMVWTNLGCLSARYRSLAPMLLFVLEVGLRLPFQYDSGLKWFKSTRGYENCGDYLNFIVLSVTLNVRPKIVSELECNKAVLKYYQPEWSNGYWVFDDLYNKGVANVFQRNGPSIYHRVLNRVFNRVLPRR